jgi:hypothetical protein
MTRVDADGRSGPAQRWPWLAAIAVVLILVLGVAGATARWERRDPLLRPVDPAVHLPHLDGHFLMIDAAEDAIVGGGPSRTHE